MLCLNASAEGCENISVPKGGHDGTYFVCFLVMEYAVEWLGTYRVDPSTWSNIILLLLLLSCSNILHDHQNRRSSFPACLELALKQKWPFFFSVQSLSPVLFSIVTSYSSISRQFQTTRLSLKLVFLTDFFVFCVPLLIDLFQALCIFLKPNWKKIKTDYILGIQKKIFYVLFWWFVKISTSKLTSCTCSWL